MGCVHRCQKRARVCGGNDDGQMAMWTKRLLIRFKWTSFVVIAMKSELASPARFSALRAWVCTVWMSCINNVDVDDLAISISFETSWGTANADQFGFALFFPLCIPNERKTRPWKNRLEWFSVDLWGVAQLKRVVRCAFVNHLVLHSSCCFSQWLCAVCVDDYH